MSYYLSGPTGVDRPSPIIIRNVSARPLSDLDMKYLSFMDPDVGWREAGPGWLSRAIWELVCSWRLFSIVLSVKTDFKLRIWPTNSIMWGGGILHILKMEYQLEKKTLYNTSSLFSHKTTRKVTKTGEGTAVTLNGTRNTCHD